MKRKTFISRLALGSGGAVLLPAASLMQGCQYVPQRRTVLTEADIPLLDELAETILPATQGVPGARGARVGEYLLLMYKDCMETEDQVLFLNGINEIDSRSALAFSSSFQDAGAVQQLELLEALQGEAIAHRLKLKQIVQPVPHYFDLLKNLTISGYFTSKIGMTQARNYLPVPGKFEACISYKQGGRPWAT